MNIRDLIRPAGHSGLGQSPPGAAVFPPGATPVTRAQCIGGGEQLYFGGQMCCVDLADGRYSCVPISDPVPGAWRGETLPPAAPTPTPGGIPPGLFPGSYPGTSYPGYRQPGLAEQFGTGTLLALGLGAVGLILLLTRK